MSVVLTTSPGFGKHGQVPDLIAQAGWEFIRAANPEEVAAHIGRADILVVGLVPVTAQTLEGADQLKAVIKHGVGTDNIDIAACTARGLPVCNTPAANADAVAELAVGHMFAMARHIAHGHGSVISGGWDRRSGIQLGRRVLGILGFGNIGRRLAKLARGLGMDVIACDPYADQDFAREWNVEIVDFETLLARSDFLSLHIFGGAENAGLFGDEVIGRMKHGARLINLARGEVVDLDAVARALESGQLGGVAIDAYEVEPPDTSHPVFAHPNAVFTPHSGADTAEAFENVGLMVIEDIHTVLRGEIPARSLNGQDLQG